MGQKVWLFAVFETKEKVCGAKTSDTWTRPAVYPSLAGSEWCAVWCSARGRGIYSRQFREAAARLTA
jgi:hypothetical protein